MELFLYEGKDEEKVLNKALEDLSLTKDEILYKKETKKVVYLKVLHTNIQLLKWKR